VAVVEAVEVPVSVAVVAEVVVVVAVVVVVVVVVVSAPAQLNTQDRRKAERRQSTLVPLPSMRSCPYWLRPILHLLLHPLRR
jgi:signal transduction histidine kinase